VWRASRAVRLKSNDVTDSCESNWLPGGHQGPDSKVDGS